MAFETTHDLIEQYKVRDNLTARERERLQECEISLEVALRQKFGNRLNEIMVRDIVGNISRDPDVFHYLVTGDTAQINPSDRASFLPIAEAKVKENDLARRNISFSDASLRTELESEFMQSIKPIDRIKYDRDNSLAGRMEVFVEAGLERAVL
jgi:hypothetical protein